MTPLGESFGPIGKPKGPFVKGKGLEHIDPAEGSAYKPPRKSSGQGLKSHLARIFDDLSSHVKMKTLERSGFQSDLYSKLHPHERKELPAKIMLTWLVQHAGQAAIKPDLPPLTLDSVYEQAKEKGYLVRDEDSWNRDDAFWRGTDFWKKFLKPIAQMGWLIHDPKTGVIRLDSDKLHSA